MYFINNHTARVFAKRVRPVCTPGLPFKDLSVCVVNYSRIFYPIFHRFYAPLAYFSSFLIFKTYVYSFNASDLFSHIQTVFNSSKNYALYYIRSGFNSYLPYLFKNLPSIPSTPLQIFAKLHDKRKKQRGTVPYLLFSTGVINASIGKRGEKLMFHEE
jgi:hypothetical protein